jgi:apolipoprotein N-acyltransferase
VVLALGGGVLLAATFPPLGLWPLVFFAPVLLFRALRGASPGEGALAGLVFGASGLAFPARWALEAALARGSGAGEAALALLLLAGGPALFGLLHAFARRAGSRAVLLDPFGWVAIEWLRSACPFVPCSWFTLAFAFGDGFGRPLAEWGTVAGESGLSLLVIASSLCVEHGIAIAPARRSRALVHVVVGLGIPVILWQVAFQELMLAAPVEAQLRSALSTVVVQDATTVETKLRLSLAGLARARADATPLVDALLWPMGSWPADPLATGRLDPELAAIAARFQRVFVFGCLRPEPGGGLVPAVIAVAPDGRVLGEHHEGGEPSVVDIGKERLGLLVGDEIASEERTRVLATRGATVLLVAADDDPSRPADAALQAARHADLRACELRRPVLRAGRRGPSFAMDSLGRFYRAIPGGESDMRLTRISGTRRTSLYLRLGHFLPRVSVLLALAWLTGMSVARRPAIQPKAAASASR